MEMGSGDSRMWYLHKSSYYEMVHTQRPMYRHIIDSGTTLVLDLVSQIIKRGCSIIAIKTDSVTFEYPESFGREIFRDMDFGNKPGQYRYERYDSSQEDTSNVIEEIHENQFDIRSFA